MKTILTSQAMHTDHSVPTITLNHNDYGILGANFLTIKPKGEMSVHFRITSFSLSSSFWRACLDISTSIICCRRASFSSSAFTRFSSTVSSSWCNRTDTSLATYRDSHPGMRLSVHQGCIQTTFEAESLSDTVLYPRGKTLEF